MGLKGALTSFAAGIIISSNPANALNTYTFESQYSGLVGDILDTNDFKEYINNIFLKKQIQINLILADKFTEDGKQLNDFSDDDFNSLIEIIYSIDASGLEIENSDDIYSYIDKKTNELEVNLGYLIKNLFKNGKINQALSYIGFLNEIYSFNIDFYIKNFFSLDDIFSEEYIVKFNNLIKNANSLNSEEAKNQYIDQLTSKQLLGVEDAGEGEKLDLFLYIIKTKLKNKLNLNKR